MIYRASLLLVWIWFCAAMESGFGAGWVGISSPTNGTVFLQPTNQPLAILISVSVTNDFDTPIDLLDGTNVLGSTSLQQHHVLTWSNIAFGEHVLQAIHHASSGPATSSVVRVRVDYGGWSIVPAGSVWYYRDGGVDLGQQWQINLDVSRWPQGPAKLGFGDDDVVTWVNFMKPDGSVWPTYYFRRSFLIPDGFACSNLAVRLRRDDGAIVYLNGQELFRDNMPPGPAQFSTYATGQVLDETEFIQRWVNPSRLRPGTNELAVEIHNSGPLSMDIGFDLALVADIPVATPKLALVRQGTNVIVRWPAGYEGYRLESARRVPGTAAEWEAVTNAPGRSQAGYALTNTIAEPARFFRLRLE
jgi:hypothetical protein